MAHKKAHHGKHHHTGKMHRGHGHPHPHTGHDKMVHPTHHKHNKAHGMEGGMAGEKRYEGTEDSENATCD